MAQRVDAASEPWGTLLHSGLDFLINTVKTEMVLTLWCWGFLEDYAFVVRGLLDLYEASQESAWLEWALRLQDTQDRLFWDSRGGGYFCSEAELGAGLPLRLKDGQ